MAVIEGLERPTKKRRIITDYVQKLHSKTKRTSLLAEFMSSIANDDLLFEIFARLPNYRALCSCAAVCRRWHSVISHPDFVSMFRRHRIDSDLPFTLLFRRRPGVCFFKRYHRADSVELLSYESAILHGPARIRSAMKAGYLDFLPPNSVEMAACKDLVVVQLPAPLHICICNPLTKQWVLLPEPRDITDPITDDVFDAEAMSYEVGFVCDFDSDSQLINYTVVLINTYDTDRIEVAVFRSEKGRWDETLAWYPLPEMTLLPIVVGTSDGILYSPLVDEDDIYKKIFAFDPSDPTGGRNYEISLPVGFETGWKAADYRARIGATRGRLRIWQSYMEEKFVLKVWQLNKKYDDWVSVVDVELEAGDNVFSNNSAVMGLHPEDDEVFFFKDNRPHIWEYNIRTGRHQKVLHTHSVLSTSLVHTIQHQRCPTLIPQLRR